MDKTNNFSDRTQGTADIGPTIYSLLVNYILQKELHMARVPITPSSSSCLF